MKKSRSKKTGIILLIVGISLLAIGLPLALFVDSPISTVLIYLSVACNIVAVNILVLRATSRKGERHRDEK